VRVAVAAGLLSDNHRSAQVGENPFKVLNYGLNAPAFGPQAQQRLLEVEIKRKRSDEMVGKQGIFPFRQILLRVCQGQDLSVQFDRVGCLCRCRPIRIIAYKQGASAQERALLIDFEKLKALTAFSYDIHAASVVLLRHRKNFRGAPDVGEVCLLGANYAELLFLLQALSDHFPVARLEDVQGQRSAGKQDDLEWEKGEQGIQAASG